MIMTDKVSEFFDDFKKEDWIKMISGDIMGSDTILSDYMSVYKENRVLKVHKYAITLLKEGRYSTYVIDTNRADKRKVVKGKDYDSLIDKLYNHYFKNNKVNAKRLCDIFDEWLEYKTKKKNNSEDTKKQNRASYEKYVKGTDIDTMPLTDIKPINLEEWAIDVLREYKMTSQTFNTHKLVVTGPLAYAKRKGYISENPWCKEELEYTHLFKSKRRKPSEKMVFYPDEIEELLGELERGYDYNGNMANLGLMINFELGLRVGELCALKWTDINWKNETVFIQRMESRGKVVDYVKSDSSAGYRELSLSDEVIYLFKKVKNDSKILSEFIFTKPDGSRLDEMVFVHRLEKAENALGWNKEGNMKRSHCIRRTVASRMQAEGWTLEEIRCWLGHTNTETTLTYLYNPFRESERKKKVKECSILHTNKECTQLYSKNDSEDKVQKMPKAL